MLCDSFIRNTEKYFTSVLIEKEEECEWIEKNMYPVTAYLMPYIYVCFIRHVYSSLFNKNKVLITNLKDL